MQAAANPRHRAELALQLARCARQLIAHRHEAAQRTAVDRAAAFRPGHDHLVADIVEHLAAIIHDGNGEQAKGAIEQAMDADAAEPFGQPRRSRDVDEQHEAVFLDRRVIPPGDEIPERARPDDVGDPEHEIRQDQKCHGIDDVDPEGFCEMDRQGAPAMTLPN